MYHENAYLLQNSKHKTKNWDIHLNALFWLPPPFLLSIWRFWALQHSFIWQIKKIIPYTYNLALLHFISVLTVYSSDQIPYQSSFLYCTEWLHTWSHCIFHYTSWLPNTWVLIHSVNQKWKNLTKNFFTFQQRQLHSQNNAKEKQGKEENHPKGQNGQFNYYKSMNILSSPSPLLWAWITGTQGSLWY